MFSKPEKLTPLKKKRRGRGKEQALQWPMHFDHN